MASARRPAGLLRQAIIDAIGRSQPERAAAIMDKLHCAGLRVQSSLFFRDLAKLVACGTVIKVNIAKGYILAPDERRVLLFCRACGQVSTIELEPVFDQIVSLAEEHRFRVSRSVIEVGGVCTTCARSPSTTVEGVTSSELAGAAGMARFGPHQTRKSCPGDDRSGGEKAEL